MLERRKVTVGVKPLEVLRAGGDLPSLGLKLRPLTMVGSQQGLRFLTQLGAARRCGGGSQRWLLQRVRQLPLGALAVMGCGCPVRSSTGA